MNEDWLCVECGYSWEQGVCSPKIPCPSCGSERRAAEASAEDQVKVIEEVRLKARHEGEGPYFFESKSGDSFSYDRQKWVSRGYSVDRERNSYEEKIVDRETGEVVLHKYERLSGHRGRGSDKKRSSGD